MTKENVNHPKHYNQHPAGIECIDIIRHYTCDIANAIKYLWRAGLKLEMGKDDADKEIEDLEKALWYIEDFQRNGMMKASQCVAAGRMDAIIREVTGFSVNDIVAQDCDNLVFLAIENLLHVGIIKNGSMRCVDNWGRRLQDARDAVQHHIIDVEIMKTNKELQSTIDVLNGNAIDGEDYVSKPGGVRDTEPDKYDPLNMLIIFGRAYCLTDEVRKKPNGALYSPCDNCSLSQECLSADGTLPDKDFCHLHQATDQEYYREVGYCKYRPSFGTIEVVDELKEDEKTLKELEEDD